MLWKLGPFVVVTPKVELRSCKAAAFLNESIIREISTGRYLELAIGHLVKK